MSKGYKIGFNLDISLIKTNETNASLEEAKDFVIADIVSELEDLILYELMKSGETFTLYESYDNPEGFLKYSAILCRETMSLSATSDYGLKQKFFLSNRKGIKESLEYKKMFISKAKAQEHTLKVLEEKCKTLKERIEYRKSFEVSTNFKMKRYELIDQIDEMETKVKQIDLQTVPIQKDANSIISRKEELTNYLEPNQS